MHYLIVGLGNIGPNYQHTRHNIGFDILDDLAIDAGLTFTDRRYGAVADLKLKGHVLTLLKPSTYMNLSGHAVRYWMQAEKIPLEQVLVVVDDVALPFGTLRLRPGGSDAGHNGLKHIQETLGTQDYARLRFGIGNDYPRGRQVDYVLAGWTPEQLETLPERIELAGKIIQQFCLAGIQRTMNEFNKR
ncbi:MAG TPA: aminoacyl-tRNA hydrolase [Bacteroidales bacterium]|jgi:PTH1 family peptidyl-tRNA hydrolase|nr:MAG: Peptidyl-tRNA hydrolase [Bacteroidetes bacterium ADurb.Bin416]HBL71601.1 aminoacyl-tRNA hydrolase [Bacteroidales bacterium]